MRRVHLAREGIGAARDETLKLKHAHALAQRVGYTHDAGERRELSALEKSLRALRSRVRGRAACVCGSRVLAGSACGASRSSVA